MSYPDKPNLLPALGNNILRFIKYILILALYLFFFGYVFKVNAEAPTIDLPEVTDKELVDFYFDKPEIMLAIAQCESGQAQFKEDGTTIHSHTNDWGYFQINATSWDKEAKRLGLDYKGNLHDNILMAEHIYKKQGLKAWSTYKNGCYKKYL